MLKRLNRHCALALASLLFSGCTTFSDINTGLLGFKGRPAEQAFAVLGFPKAETMIAGRKVYLWSSDFSVSGPAPTQSTTTGQIGGRPFSAVTSGTEWTEQSYSCQIRLFVDDQDVVQNYDYEGDYGGCDSFAIALKRNR